MGWSFVAWLGAFLSILNGLRRGRLPEDGLGFALVLLLVLCAAAALALWGWWALDGWLGRSISNRLPH